MRRVALPEVALVIGGVAAAILVAAWFHAPDQAAGAWLGAFLFWIGLPVGALFIVLAHALIGGAWIDPLRPALAGMLRSLRLLAWCIAPVLLAAPQIYPWARTADGGWLDLRFFAARAVVYLAIWLAIAMVARRHVLGEATLPPARAWPALIELFLTTSLAALDWIMSLEPHFVSTIFGMMVTAGWFSFAVACAVAGVAWRVGADAGERLDPLAQLLQASIILWAYLAAVQLIVIWESDLSAEIPWYLRRGAAGWEAAATALALLRFVVPFLLLLWQPLRRAPAAVLIAAGAVMLGHLADTWWLTIPDYRQPFCWVDPLAVVAIGGLLLFFIGRGPFLQPIRMLARPRHG
jgi:hypothetical protein